MNTKNVNVSSQFAFPVIISAPFSGKAIVTSPLFLHSALASLQSYIQPDAGEARVKQRNPSAPTEGDLFAVTIEFNVMKDFSVGDFDRLQELVANVLSTSNIPGVRGGRVVAVDTPTKIAWNSDSAIVSVNALLSDSVWFNERRVTVGFPEIRLTQDSHGFVWTDDPHMIFQFKEPMEDFLGDDSELLSFRVIMNKEVVMEYGRDSNEPDTIEDTLETFLNDLDDFLDDLEESFSEADRKEVLGAIMLHVSQRFSAACQQARKI